MLPDFPTCPDHDQEVALVAARVRSFYQSKSPFRIYHGSTNSTRKSARRHDTIIDISHLKHMLTIHVTQRTGITFVEPNIPMDELVTETLKLGLIPPVVMEFPGITAGGGFAGTSGESSSFRHGFFDRTVKAVEIILGNGEVAKASPDDPRTAELFYAAAASFGTMGVVTLLALELVEAKPFVELTYLRISSVSEAVQRFEDERHKDEVDYMDGILFTKDSGVVCLGSLTSAIPLHAEPMTFSKPWDDWFYLNAENQLADPSKHTWVEYIPIQDYLFRYERGAFWISKYTYQYFAVPLNKFTRWLLDTYTHTRIMYNALHHSGLSSKYVVQDVAVPYEGVSEFVSYLDEKLQKYPLWLCPLHMRGQSPNSAYGLLADAPDCANPHTESMLNFGVWAAGPEDQREFVAWNKALENKISELKGQKWLYAHTYYDEDQFWTNYGDRQRYDVLRSKYHAESLPDLHEKVRVLVDSSFDGEHNWWSWCHAIFWNIWPLAGLYGWVMCVISAEYLLPRRGQSTAQVQARARRAVVAEHKRVRNERA